ncbi:hypothetical protein QTA58_00315 [Neorhizobium sp. CSC1952]|uniref:hypothetical protein n=1 Tax=Neorhizobium sp. CSC1952 TaxID=2978974 RepID=UPI0025A4EDAF|nr:hypothetical protein [Rhizobium sp. CSC1952]WJR67252.1 hypothetical protein QTA58_00315 [Rhizobium sp. CSC1952]
MPEFNPRDKSRTTRGKTFNEIRKNSRPPSQGAASADSSQRWQWLTVELLSSPAFRTLSPNASRAFFRIIIEHAAHGALENGKLIVTHPQFVEHGVTGEYVADAIDELEYKGLIKIKRGRAGAGTAHPNLYTLTFSGDYEGAPATNEWRKCSLERCRRWDEVDRKIAKANREKLGRKKIASLRNPEMRPLRNPEMRKAG